MLAEIVKIGVSRGESVVVSIVFAVRSLALFIGGFTNELARKRSLSFVAVFKEQVFLFEKVHAVYKADVAFVKRQSVILVVILKEGLQRRFHLAFDAFFLAEFRHVAGYYIRDIRNRALAEKIVIIYRLGKEHVVGVVFYTCEQRAARGVGFVCLYVYVYALFAAFEFPFGIFFFKGFNRLIEPLSAYAAVIKADRKLAFGSVRRAVAALVVYTTAATDKRTRRYSAR